MLLSELKPDSVALVESLRGSEKFKNNLSRRGLVKGRRLKVISTWGAVTFLLSGRSLMTVGCEMADKIAVQRLTVKNA